jgi:hypothetical protein
MKGCVSFYRNFLIIESQKYGFFIEKNFIEEILSLVAFAGNGHVHVVRKNGVLSVDNIFCPSNRRLARQLKFLSV